MSNITYKYSKRIADEVRSGIMAGLKVTVIHDAAMRHAECPRSIKHFMDKYRDDIAQARLDYQMALGDAANIRIQEGSDKILELALRSKAGWNPSVRVEEAKEADNEETSALERLTNLLGKELIRKDQEEE